MFYQDYHHHTSFRTAQWVYAAFAICIVAIFGYVVFSFTAYIENKKIASWNARSAAVSAMPNQKIDEKNVADYQKKIANYRVISNNHKITSHVFTFIEERTLPAVWFSSFDMAQATYRLTLKGEAENMATLSRQVKIFESSTEYIKSVAIADSRAELSGKIAFTVNLILTPAMFSYTSVPLPPKNP